MKIILGAFIGSAAGTVLFFFGKCISGSCPIINDPLVAVITFSVVGIGVAGLISGKKE